VIITEENDAYIIKRFEGTHIYNPGIPLTHTHISNPHAAMTVCKGWAATKHTKTVSPAKEFAQALRNRTVQGPWLLFLFLLRRYPLGSWSPNRLGRGT